MEMNLRFKRRKVYRKKDNSIEQWERRLILASTLALLVTFGKYIPHVYQVVANGGVWCVKPTPDGKHTRVYGASKCGIR